jgi:putative tRNA adenosine deaminase-associated protein
VTPDPTSTETGEPRIWFGGTDEPTGGIVSYFAAAVVRDQHGWTASKIDLDGTADIEEVSDRLRDAGPEAVVSLLFVESDDAYLVILRLDEGEDPRVFCSDADFAEESRLGMLLLGDIEEPALDLEAGNGGETDESVEETIEPGQATGAPPDVEPIGDPDLLSDLGMPAHHLLELCTHQGLLPSDVTAEICQALGCGDEIEELREV